MNAFVGTGSLIRLILRRDRIRISVWILAIAGLTVLSPASFPEIYPTAADRQARAALMNNPATIMITGPGYGLDNYTYGAMIAHELTLWVAGAMALMSIFLVIRHTRADEEGGRTELLRATVVGRHAATTATLVTVGAVNVVIGLLIALGLPVILPELSQQSSLLFGAATASVGLVFAAVAAVTAQVTEHSRGAAGLGIALLGLAIALRAAGDLGNGTLSWLSPIGWAQRTRVYVDDRWWPLLLSVALVAVLSVAAYALSVRRDVGAGLVRPRPGPAGASAALTNPFGLVLRQQRGILVGWTVGLLLFGLFIGSMASQAGDFVTENETLRQFILRGGSESELIDTVLSTYIFLAALVAIGYAVQAALLLRSEESAGRAEPLLGTALPRGTWVASHLVITLIGTVVVVGVAGVGAGLLHAATTGDAGQFPRLLVAALAHLPGVWVFVGLAIGLFGIAPRAVGLAWAAMAAVILVGMLGPLLQLPEWAADLSPFAHTPQLPAGEFTLGPPAVLTAVAIAFTAVGFVGFRRRDVAA